MISCVNHHSPHLINPSGRADKFYTEDRFGEPVFKLSKEKSRPSAYAKTGNFLREVVSLNSLALWKSKEVMARATGATDHTSHHAEVDPFVDVRVIVNLLLEEKAFQELPDRGSGEHEETKHADLFSNGSAKICS